MNEQVDLIVFTFYALCMVFWLVIFFAVGYVLNRLGIIDAVGRLLFFVFRGLVPWVLLCGVLFMYMMMAITGMVVVPDEYVTAVVVSILLSFAPIVYIGLITYKFGLRLTRVTDTSHVLGSPSPAVVPSAVDADAIEPDTGVDETAADNLFAQAKEHLAAGQKKRAIAVLRYLASQHPDTRAGKRAIASLNRTKPTNQPG